MLGQQRRPDVAVGGAARRHPEDPDVPAPAAWLHDGVADHRASRNRRRLTATVTDLTVRRQRALLVSLAADGRSTADAELSLLELARLTDTAGSDPVEQVVQQRSRDRKSVV